MNIFGKWSYSWREFSFIFDNDFSDIISIDLPAVVDINIDISFFIKSKLNNFISSFFDKSFIKIALKMIPAVPSHLRCFSQTIINRISNKNE